MKRITFFSLSKPEFFSGRLNLYLTTAALFFVLNSVQATAQIFTRLESPTNTNPSTGCGWIDYNGDGNLDAYFSYFNVKCSLYPNLGNGKFDFITSGDLIAQQNNCSAITWGDYDNDGKPDLYVTSMSGQNRLFRNLGDGNFKSMSNSKVVTNDGSYLSANWVDYNNDGFLDLFVTASGISFTPSAGNNNLLFKNNGDGNFTRITDAAIASQRTFSNCAAFGDYDNDGFIDLLVSDASYYGYLIYHNNGNKNNWLSIECKGKISNSSAIGARVKINATIFGKTFWQIREITGVQGFRGCNDLRAHFGLGDALKIDSLVVIFPSKQVTVLTDFPVNQIIKVTETVPNNYIKSNFKADTLSGYSPLKVKFADLSLNNKKHPITSWSWDFDGDGIVDSHEKNPTFIYDVYSGKNFPVSLNVSNGIDSASSIRNDYIRIFPMYEQNIALHKKVSSSSSRLAYYSADKITDEIGSTRWLSVASDTQWVQIELDSVYSIGKIVLDWYSNYTLQYNIRGSKDSIDWFDVFSKDNGAGGLEEFSLKSVRAKFIRLEMNKSSNNNGFGLYEIKIFRPEVTAVYKVKKTPNEFRLLQNFPNPFNPTTAFCYQLSEVSHVTIRVYDILGREVATLVNEEKTACIYRVEFNASHLSSGIYFYTLKAGNMTDTKKMILLR